MSMLNENKILRKNIKDLQEQLTKSHIRISKLTNELHYLKKELNPFDPRISNSPWAELPAEEDKNQFKLNLKKEKENE
tara:strand:- start:6600 stop:6833 length:234 start_codon:yes stop_codon:yes gene_type:complete